MRVVGVLTYLALGALFFWLGYLRLRARDV
jgi:hypothetical protein